MGARDDTGKYLGDAVYGALDGIVTTFAVVAGVAGAQLSSAIILIMGLANLFADGVSMAAGNYLSKRSDLGYREREREGELRDIEHDPEQAREEVRKIYSRKGFSGELLERVVATITGDKARWADETMVGEHQLLDTGVSPVRAGLTTLAAFVLVGSVPLLSYILALAFPSLLAHAFLVACVLTALALFTVGSLRSLLMAKAWWKAGLEMLLVGGFAAGVAYLVGFLLQGLA